MASTVLSLLMQWYTPEYWKSLGVLIPYAAGGGHSRVAPLAFRPELVAPERLVVRPEVVAPEQPEVVAPEPLARWPEVVASEGLCSPCGRS